MRLTISVHLVCFVRLKNYRTLDNTTAGPMFRKTFLNANRQNTTAGR